MQGHSHRGATRALISPIFAAAVSKTSAASSEASRTKPTRTAARRSRRDA